MTVIQTPRGPSVEGAGAEFLRELLAELEAELRARDARVDEDLNVGLPRDHVRRRFESAGLIAPDEVVEWLAWKNGATKDVLRSHRNGPLPRFEFWDLEKVLEVRRDDEGTDFYGTEDWQWNPVWLHLIGDNNGIAVSMADDPENAPLVRGLSFGDFNTATDFVQRQVVSLCTPVSWWIEDLKSGIFAWDEDRAQWQVRWTELPEWRRVLGYG